ncbi:MAG: hypothetical protein ABS55_02925 [Lautropia sp. SCN 70-15]|nr:MAG: hypothetical protein ABS55_02925 [Lautropia sp. SCN 70-15]
MSPIGIRTRSAFDVDARGEGRFVLDVQDDLLDDTGRKEHVADNEWRLDAFDERGMYGHILEKRARRGARHNLATVLRCPTLRATV